MTCVQIICHRKCGKRRKLRRRKRKREKLYVSPHMLALPSSIFASSRCCFFHWARYCPIFPIEMRYWFRGLYLWALTKWSNRQCSRKMWGSHDRWRVARFVWSEKVWAPSTSLLLISTQPHALHAAHFWFWIIGHNISPTWTMKDPSTRWELQDNRPRPRILM